MDLEYIYYSGGVGEGDTILEFDDACRVFELINTSASAQIMFKSEKMRQYSIPVDAKDCNILPLEPFEKIKIKTIGENATYKWQAYGLA